MMRRRRSNMMTGNTKESWVFLLTCWWKQDKMVMTRVLSHCNHVLTCLKESNYSQTMKRWERVEVGMQRIRKTQSRLDCISHFLLYLCFLFNGIGLDSLEKTRGSRSWRWEQVWTRVSTSNGWIYSMQVDFFYYISCQDFEIHWSAAAFWWQKSNLFLAIIQW